jgi:hypothetical protein
MSPEGVTQQTNNVPLQAILIFPGTFPLMSQGFLEYKQCGQSSSSHQLTSTSRNPSNPQRQRCLPFDIKEGSCLRKWDPWDVCT